MALNMREVWAVAEQRNGSLCPVSFEMLAWGAPLAEKLGARLCAVVPGYRISGDDINRLASRGAQRILIIDHRELEHFSVIPFGRALERLALAERPEIIIAGATSAGRALMPWLAVRLNTGLTADCTGLDIDPKSGNLIQTRPAIGGNVMATIITPRHRPQMATVRPHTRRPLPPKTNAECSIERIDIPDESLASLAEIISIKKSKEGDSTTIQDADRIVAGGRGLKNAANFRIVESLAEKMGAAVGASREAVDRGWAPYSRQVGLSGKSVNPDLYLALGISGSIQHLAGMKTAGCIVAINSDPDAQIFKVADFGIVGDLFEIAPALEAEIERRRIKRGRSG